MATLRLRDADPGAARPAADLFGCAYSPDGAHVLSAGWDGFLRLWDVGGEEVASAPVGAKPLSACAFSPDGKYWLAGSIEGFLSFFDAAALAPAFSFVAHTRPISALRYSPDGALLATASWDRQVVLRKAGREREGKVLSGHGDVVSGCRFTPDGGGLLSWSHDGTLRLWDVASGREQGVLKGHADRVTAGALSPDGRWAASGGRDGVLKLWDLATQTATRTVVQSAEIRACCFLPDGESLLTVNAEGRVGLLALPGLDVQSHLRAGLKPQCADLAPGGLEAALGGEDGRVHFVAVDGLENAALLVTATPQMTPAKGVLGRLLGQPRFVRTFHYTCPACRRPAECAAPPKAPFPCPACRRPLRVHVPALQLQER